MELMPPIFCKNCLSISRSGSCIIDCTLLNWVNELLNEMPTSIMFSGVSPTENPLHLSNVDIAQPFIDPEIIEY